MRLYRIKDWSKRYENNRTRELKRLEWVPIPNAHDGEGYTLTATQKNGAELLGSWMILLQVASRCGQRGTLMRDTGIPHDSTSISRISRIPEKTIAEALRWFASHEVQWLEIVNQEGQLELTAAGCDNPAPSCDNPASGCLEGKGIEGNRSEGKPSRTAGAVPASLSDQIAELGKNPAYAGINIGMEYAKLQAWCGANKKTPSYRRFVNWLNRAEKPMPRQITIAQQSPQSIEPQGWRETLKQLIPDGTYDGSWATLADSVKQKIREASKP